MTPSTEPLSSPTRSETQVERVLLSGVPAAKHAELLPLLRSPDRTVREVALVLIQLDREEAARQPAQRRPPGVPGGW